MNHESAVRTQRFASLGLLAAVAASYVLSFAYVRWCLFALGGSAVRVAYPAFALPFVLCVEVAARAFGRRGADGHWFWAVCYLVLSASISIWNIQPLPIGGWEFLVWHAFAVYWVLARTGKLGDGRSGIMLPLDFFKGLMLGIANIFLRMKSFWRLLAVCGRLGTNAPTPNDIARTGRVSPEAEGRVASNVSELNAGCGCPQPPARRERDLSFAGLITSLVLAAGVCLVAWILLALGDAKFSAFTEKLLSGAGDAVLWLFHQLSFVDFVALVLSIPVGAWLFGLVGGCVCREGPEVGRESFNEVVSAIARLPRAAAVTIPLSLLAVYLVFFGVQAADFSAAVASTAPMVARRARTFAVDGFWYLFWIMLLDFAVLGGLHYLGRNVSSERLAVRLLLAAFLVAGFAVGLLGGWKLWNYIQLGWTPRRILSAWFLCVMMAWNALAVARLFVPFLAVRWAICILGGSFAALCALPVARICAGA